MPPVPGAIPAAHPLNRSWVTTDCLHCGALLTWVGYEQAIGWQIVDSADVESAE